MSLLSGEMGVPYYIQDGCHPGDAQLAFREGTFTGRFPVSWDVVLGIHRG